METIQQSAERIQGGIAALAALKAQRKGKLGTLFSGCQQCKCSPTHVTRQRAFAKRAAGEWRQACAEHAPADGRFHETATIPQ